MSNHHLMRWVGVVVFLSTLFSAHLSLAETIHRQKQFVLQIDPSVFQKAADEVLQTQNLHRIFENFDLSTFSRYVQSQLHSSVSFTSFEYQARNIATEAPSAPEVSSGWGSWLSGAGSLVSSVVEYVGGDAVKAALDDLTDRTVRGQVVSIQEESCPGSFERQGYRLKVNLKSSGLLVRNMISDFEIQVCFSPMYGSPELNQVDVQLDMNFNVGSYFSSFVNPETAFERVEAIWVEAFETAIYSRQNEIRHEKSAQALEQGE